MNERVRLGSWKPGQDGKGLLLTGPPYRLRLWRTGPDLGPHHAEAERTLGITRDSVACYLTIRPPNLLYLAPVTLDEEEAGRIICACEPRLEVYRGEPWTFG